MSRKKATRGKSRPYTTGPQRDTTFGHERVWQAEGGPGLNAGILKALAEIGARDALGRPRELPPGKLCTRCGRVYKHVGYIVNNECRNRQLCDWELAARTREWNKIEAELGVASRAERAHNGGVQAPPHKEEPGMETQAATFEDRVAKVRQMLKDGKGIMQIRESTNFGVGTIAKMKAEPNYQPNKAISANRAKQWQEGKRTGHPNPTKKQPVPVVAVEQTSIRTKTLLLLAKGEYMTLDALRRDANAFEGRAEGKGYDNHELWHVLRSLEKQGLIYMRTQRRGENHQMLRATITNPGLVEVEKLRPGWVAPPRKPTEVAPVERVVAPPRQNEQPAAPVPAPVPAPAQGPSYPLLRALLKRGSKVRAAATLLREAGMVDAAELIEGTSLDYTPLENEIINLLEHADATGIGSVNGSLRSIIDA